MSHSSFSDVSECIIAGNHESETMNQMYGFEGEVKSKYPFILRQFCVDKSLVMIWPHPKTTCPPKR